MAAAQDVGVMIFNVEERARFFQPLWGPPPLTSLAVTVGAALKHAAESILGPNLLFRDSTCSRTLSFGTDLAHECLESAHVPGSWCWALLCAGLSGMLAGCMAMAFPWVLPCPAAPAAHAGISKLRCGCFCNLMSVSCWNASRVTCRGILSDSKPSRLCCELGLAGQTESTGAVRRLLFPACCSLQGDNNTLWYNPHWALSDQPKWWPLAPHWRQQECLCILHYLSCVNDCDSDPHLSWTTDSWFGPQQKGNFRTTSTSLGENLPGWKTGPREWCWVWLVTGEAPQGSVLGSAV